MIIKRTLIFLFLFLLTGQRMICQSTYRFGAIPSMNLNTDFKNGWGFNVKSEFRHMFRQGIKAKKPTLSHEYIHTDLAFLGSKKVGLGNRVIAGFLLRIREDEIVQRYIQQYILNRAYDGYRMSYRFALDQTLDEIFEIRFRMRTSLELPLNGKKADTREFYLKFNQEVLHNFEGSSYDLEFRCLPFLGYKFRDNNKIEMGLDYRIDSFINQEPRHTAWVALNWYLKI